MSKSTYKLFIDEALKKYIAGEQLYLGDYSSITRGPRNIAVRQKYKRNELRILEAIMDYELNRGGLVVKNGVYQKTEKCGPLPCFRNRKTPL